MTLHKQITQKLEQVSHNDVLKAMGYHNLKTGHKTLQKFLDTDTIYLWLKIGNFDMKYDSESFLRALLKAVNFPASLAEDEIQESQKRLGCIARMKELYIFIDTHFKRSGESVFVLAMLGGRRHISIDKELLVYKSKTEIFEEIGKIIRQHYLAHEGRLDLWGEIYTYVYHHSDGNQYIFNPDGTLSKGHEDIPESKAELRLGNQKITFIQDNMLTIDEGEL